MENQNSTTQTQTAPSPAAASPTPATPAATQESLQGDTSAPQANLQNHPFGMGTGAPVGVPPSAAPRVNAPPTPAAPGTGPIPAPTGPGPVPLGYNDLAAQLEDIMGLLQTNGPAAAKRLQDWINRERSIAYAHGK